MHRKNIPLLKPGDKAGLIAPAGFITEEKLEKAVKNLEKSGLSPVFFNNITDKSGYLAGKDERRIDELHRMFDNKEVKAIFCVRGGYGTMRILDKINYELIKQNPKPLIGYSDITALINAIYKKTKMPGFHGILGSEDFTDFTFEALNEIFFKTSKNIKVSVYEKHKKDILVINEGVAEGKLAGGNLALEVSLLGTKYDVSWKNKIIFLEDTGEAPYKIDRMLTQLILAGKFKNVKAVIFGRFSGCEAENNSSFSLKAVISDRMKHLKIPVVYGYSFGHIKNKIIFPYGINAEFDTSNLTLKIKRKKVNEFFI